MINIEALHGYNTHYTRVQKLKKKKIAQYYMYKIIIQFLMFLYLIVIPEPSSPWMSNLDPVTKICMSPN